MKKDWKKEAKELKKVIDFLIESHAYDLKEERKKAYREGYADCRKINVE